MKTLQTLLLVALAISLGDFAPSQSELDKRSVIQLGEMIQCVIPGSQPLLQYSNYGCYCGPGGSGTPVDELDRCCQVHDQCYGDAKKHPKCRKVIDSPYTMIYKYNCDKSSKKITCGNNNSECGMFICECDRVAAECFSTAPYNPQYKNMNQKRCREST